MIESGNRLSNKTQKDLTLLIPLLVLNVASGYTTIHGAELALGDAGIAIIAGISVQGILFILLSGNAAKHAPIRKWLAVLVFGFFSIYTSFFTYYDTFVTNDQMVGASYMYAETNHQALVDTAVNPILEEFRGVDATYQSLEEEIRQEEGGDGETGLPGRGPRATSLIQQKNALAPTHHELEATTLRLENLLEEARRMDSSDPEQLFILDKEIWEAVPQEYRPENYKGPQREDYFDQASRYQLLAPILSLTGNAPDTKKKPSSAALAIATAIDGVSIMLGTAIDKRARRAPFEGVTFFFVQIIWGTKKAIKTVLHYWRRPGYRYVNAADSETVMARDAVYLIKLKLNDRGSDFLASFLSAVDPVEKKIDYAKLKEEPDQTLRTGFRLLLESLRHPSLNWVRTTQNSDEWVFRNLDSYSEFCKWLSDELIYQAEQEGIKGIDFESETSPKIIKFRRPLSA